MVKTRDKFSLSSCSDLITSAALFDYIPDFDWNYVRINWLRVLDTAESSQVDQCVGHQFHAIMPLLYTFEAE